MKNIKNFLSKKLFDCEKAYSLTKNDREYLKSELKTQNQVVEKLTENLQTAEYELQQSKRQNLNLKNQLDDSSKKYQDDVN